MFKLNRVMIKRMKIAIISDTHDNLANIEAFLVLAKEEKVEGLIHCGDVTTPETLEKLVENFEGPIKLVCGNAEIRREEFLTLANKFPNLEVFAIRGEWQVDQLKVAFSHQPALNEDETGFNFVFHGHTHKPWFGEIGTTIIANPGTLGGVFTLPTFACLDTLTGRLELKKLY